MRNRKVRPALPDAFKGHVAFKPGQPSTETAMDSVTEGQRRPSTATDVKGVRLIVDTGIAGGAARQQKHRGIGGDGAILELDGSNGKAALVLGGRMHP